MTQPGLDGVAVPMRGKKRAKPEVWPSGVSRYLAGKSNCGFRVWFPAWHQKYAKRESDFDFAAWNVEHTALVTATRQTLEADGWDVSTEGQNFFRLEGGSAILVGKPDLVARRRGIVKIVDCKGGAPGDEHVVQVAIYMIALPRAWNRGGLYVTGEVVYKTHAVTIDPDQALALQPKIFAVLRTIGGAEMAKVPSADECRYCDLVECPARVPYAAPPATPTEDF